MLISTEVFKKGVYDESNCHEIAEACGDYICLWNCAVCIDLCTTLFPKKLSPSLSFWEVTS